jgi:hypothetical protein
MKPSAAGMKVPTGEAADRLQRDYLRVRGGERHQEGCRGTKIRLAQTRKRRAPITVLSQAAVRRTTIICAAEKNAVSQAPSSKPRLNPPRISARPKV